MPGRLATAQPAYLEDNAVDPAEVPEILLLEVGVALVLEHGWQVLLGLVHHLPDLGQVEVGEADGPVKDSLK